MAKRRCNEKMVVYSRVVGFYSPLNQWNKGKKEEFRIRKTFKINEDDLDEEEEIECEEKDESINEENDTSIFAV